MKNPSDNRQKFDAKYKIPTIDDMVNLCKEAPRMEHFHIDNVETNGGTETELAARPSFIFIHPQVYTNCCNFARERADLRNEISPPHMIYNIITSSGTRKTADIVDETRQSLKLLLKFLWAAHKGYVTTLAPEFPHDGREAGKKMDSATTRFANAEQVFLSGQEWNSNEDHLEYDENAEISEGEHQKEGEEENQMKGEGEKTDTNSNNTEQLIRSRHENRDRDDDYPPQNQHRRSHRYPENEYSSDDESRSRRRHRDSHSRSHSHQSRGESDRNRRSRTQVRSRIRRHSTSSEDSQFNRAQCNRRSRGRHDRNRSRSRSQSPEYQRHRSNRQSREETERNYRERRQDPAGWSTNPKAIPAWCYPAGQRRRSNERKKDEAKLTFTSSPPG